MRARRWLGAWFLWMLAPLVLTSLTRPFGWWDYLTTLARATPDAAEFGFKITGVWLPFDFTAPGALARNYSYNITGNPYVLRPTLSLLYHLQALAFGGEFWLWYVVKWASLLGIVWIAVRILRAFEAPEGVCWVAAALVLFHPCSFDLMLCNADSWMAVGIIGVLGLLILHDGFAGAPFDVTVLGRARYAAVLAVWYLTMGVKESALAWSLSVALALTWSSSRSRGAWLRLAPFYLALAYWVWRLSAISRQRLAGHGVEGYPRKVWELIQYLEPDSPLHVFGLLLAALLICGLAWTLWRESAARKRLWLLASAAAGGVILMSARFHSAPRCDIPVVHLLGMLTGLALAMFARQWPWRGWPVAWILMAVSVPFFNSANLYNQALAFQQLFLDFADTLRVIEDKIANGYQLAFTGREDVGHESQAAVALYFRQFGTQFYALPVQPRKIYVVDRDGTPPEPFVLLTAYTPVELTQGKLPGLKPEAIEEIEYIERGRYGALENLAGVYTRWNCRIGNCRKPSYDVGAPVVSASPSFYIVTAGKPGRGGDPVDAMKFLCGVAEAPCNLEAARGQSLVRRAAIGSWKGWQRVVVEGQIKVERGPVFFGVSNLQGRDLWNQQLPVKDGWQSFPEPPPIEGKGEEYSFFVFVPNEGAARFSLRGVKIRRTGLAKALAPSRRYGAVGR